jgi:two-component system sensor histidine kinase SenX3
MVLRKRRATSGSEPLREVPDGVHDLLRVIDAEFLVLAPGEIVIESSERTDALGLVRDGRLISDPVLNLVRATRRSGEYQEATLSLPRGPIGEGAHDLLVRVSPVENQGMVVVLIFDDSEFRRLDAIRRDFVANISHELKTPIGALSILSEAVLGAKDDPEAIVRFATRMQMEATRLSDLVQEIIDLSRLQDDDPLKRAKIINLSPLLKEVIDGLGLEAETRGISLVAIDFADVQILGDKRQIEMAVRNLVENAIHYSPDGTRVAVSLNLVEGLAEIHVSDQGVGIPEKDIERIFERFYRVDPARSRATGGTGLGLSIVKHVVINHGGDVSVWSVEGAGSTFTIRLPLYFSQSESTQVED